MKAHSSPFYVRVDRSLALVAAAVLGVGIFYIFAYVLVAPYPGLDFNVNWQILAFDRPCEERPDWCAMRDRTLQVGDRLLVIGDLTYAEYRRRPERIPFWGYKPGDQAPIVFERDGVARRITWEILGPTGESRFTRLVGLLIFLPFWLAGTAVLLFLRPRNTLWYLLIAFNYLTALWIASGIPSAYHIGGSIYVLRGATWLMAPVYLHLHLIAPQPLFDSGRRRLLVALYVIGGSLAVLQPFIMISSQVHYSSLLFALLGSVALLVARLIRPTPSQARPALRLMLAGAGLTFALAAILWVVPSMTTASAAGQLAINIMTFAIALLPFLYVYALYKRQLGSVEFRANRVLSLISFFAIYITTYLFVFVLGTRWVSFSSAALAFALTTSVIFVALGLVLKGPFQRLIDRIAYGTVHNPNDILRAFANEIPRALNHRALSQVLAQQVMPSLLVRQWALYRVGESSGALLHAEGIAPPQEDATAVKMLLEQSGRYRPPDEADKSVFNWVRLPIAVQVGGKTIAAWLLGGRDPDDFYPQPDIELLTTLAGEVGVALENARLFENLQNRAAELEHAYAELQELDSLKDEFIRKISHELRTPLTLIQGYADLLLKGVLGKLTDTQREALTTVAERSSDLIQLVNQIISIQGDSLMALTPEAVSLTGLAQSCLRAAEERSKRQRPEITYQFELQTTEDLPPVWGDRRRLAEVFDNLLDNAIKFSPTGGRIVVAMHPTLHPLALAGDDRLLRPAVHVSVSDQGIGIPQDKTDRVWDQFFQLDGSTRRSYGGLGLGLTIVRHTVEAHHGVVWAESVVGVGSTFHFVLPTLEAIKGLPDSG